MADTNQTVLINIKAETAKATSEIKRLNRELRNLGRTGTSIKTTTKSVDQMSRSFGSLTKHISQLAIIYGAFQGLQTTIRTFADFEASISRLGVISGATSTELVKMQEVSEELGSTTVFTASQVADGMNSMAMAGLSANEAMAAIEGTLDLASIGQINVAESSLIATRAMNGFGLESEDMGRISDVMARTVTSSATSVTQLGDAYRKVASVSNQFGNSIEETSAVLGVLADAGRVGAESGTQLKIAMLRLTANVEVKKYLQDLSDATGGLSTNMYEADGKAKTFIKQLETLRTATAGLSDEARNTHLARIVGSEAVASFTVAINSLDEIKAKVALLEDSFGFASKTAKELMDNLTGDFKEFNSALEGVILDLGKGLSPVLRQLLDEATDFLQQLDSGKVEEFGEGVGELAIVLSDMVKGVMGIADAIITFSEKIEYFTGLSASSQIELLLLGKAMTVVYKMASPLGLALQVSATGVFALRASMIAMGKPVSLVTLLIGKLRYAMIALNLAMRANPIGFVITALFGLGVIIAKVTSDSSKYEKQQQAMADNTEKNAEIIAFTTEELGKLDTQARETYGSYVQDQIRATTKEIENLKDQIEDEKDSIWVNDDAIAALTKTLKSHEEQLIGLTAHEKKLIEIAKEKREAKKAESDAIVKNTEAYKVNQKAIKKQIEANEKEIESINKNLKSRVDSTLTAIAKIKKEEEKLVEELLKLDKKLADDRKALDEERKGQVSSLSEKLADIDDKGLKNYARYKSEQTRADKAHSLALQAIKDGDLEALIRQRDIELDLISRNSGDEINDTLKIRDGYEENGQIKWKSIEKNRLTQKASSAEYKRDLISIDVLDKAILKFKDDKLTSIYNIEKASIEARAKGLKAQLLTQTEYLVNLGKIATLMTGIEPNFDFTQTLKAVADIDTKMSKSASKKRVVNLDLAMPTDVATADYNALVALVEKPLKPLVKVDTIDANKKTEELTEKIVAPKEYAVSYKKALADGQLTINALAQTAEEEKIEMNLIMKVQKAEAELRKISENIDDLPRHELNLKIANAKANIQDIVNKILAIPNRTVYVDVVERYHSTSQARQEGGSILPRFEEGGHTVKTGKLGGYGGGDKIKALLEAGEFIVRKEAVKALGLRRLEEINRGNIPRFQHGGSTQPAAVQRFSTGGEVASNNPNKTVNLNLNLGGKNFPVVSDEQVANSLASFLQRGEF